MNEKAKTNDDFKKHYRSKLYKEIKNDLLNQNERNGTLGKYYIDLIEDYMDMWITKCLLISDIKERGINVEYNNGGGQSGIKKNESVDQLMKMNAQMLKLLAELGIKPAQSGGEDDDL
jgi:hypothetical protein